MPRIDDPFAMNGHYGDLVQSKLEEVISGAPPRRIALVIKSILENLVLTERIAEQRGVHVSDADKGQLLEKELPEIQAEVDRAVGIFIGSVVSAEGG